MLIRFLLFPSRVNKLVLTYDMTLGVNELPMESTTFDYPPTSDPWDIRYLMTVACFIHVTEFDKKRVTCFTCARVKSIGRNHRSGATAIREADYRGTEEETFPNQPNHQQQFSPQDATCATPILTPFMAERHANVPYDRNSETVKGWSVGRLSVVCARNNLESLTSIARERS